MLVFERGEQARPKGHALLYYRDAQDAAKVYATYVVVLPIALDLVKYMPPIFASHAAELEAHGGLSSFAFPPMPEPAESYERVQQLAQARDDDLLDGGQADPQRAQRWMEAVNDLAQQYAGAYNAYVNALPHAAPPPPQRTAAPKGEAGDQGGFGVNEVLYEFLSDRDRLAEMTKLIGTLRFALGGGDKRLVADTLREALALAKRLPKDARVEEMMQAVQDPSPDGARLAQLYLDRCYKLLDADAKGVQELEERIRAAQAQQ
jgi:hypothetical protein